MAELSRMCLPVLTAASGQPSEAGDARVRRYEPVDSGAQEAPSVFEIPGWIIEAPSTAVELSYNDEVEGTTPPTVTRGEPDSSPRSKVVEGAKISPSGGRARVTHDTSPSRAVIGSPELSSERPTDNPPFGLHL